MRRAGAVISRGSGALLVVAGAYVAWYGWFEIRALAGDVTADPVAAAAARVQQAVTRRVAGLGAAGLLVVAAVAVAVTAVLMWRSRRREPA